MSLKYNPEFPAQLCVFANKLKRSNKYRLHIVLGKSLLEKGKTAPNFSTKGFVLGALMALPFAITIPK